MSTYTKATPSTIPRATRAAPPAAIGPRPTKASLLRASQIKEGMPAEKRKGVVIQQRPEIKMAGRPAGGEMKRRDYARLVGKKDEGAVGGGKGKAAKGVAAPAENKVVSFYGEWVKKADSSSQPKKKVRFAEVVEVKEFEVQSCEKGPKKLKKGEKPELWEGEPDWEYLKAEQQYNCEKRRKLKGKAKAWLREEEDPNETGYLRMMEARFKGYRKYLASWFAVLLADESWSTGEDDEFDNLKAKKTWEVVESAAMFYLDELVAEEKANLEKTQWSIYTFGGNPMLDDEEMPFKMEGDEEFDGIMTDLIALQEEKEQRRRAEQEERRVIGEMADALATILDQDLAEAEMEEDYLPALYLYGPNPTLMDEPMPFALPETQPDTTIELAAPSDMSMLVDEQAPPHVLDPRASLPNLWVPEPRPEDFRDMAMDLDALADQGIMASDTDFDLCQRLQRGVTAFISTAEERWFTVPTPFEFNFARRLEIYEKDGMVTDEEFPGKVCPALDALGADDTLLPFETDPVIQRRLRHPNILDEMTGPGYVWLAMEDRWYGE